MADTIQDFLADATMNSARELTEAFARLPEDKREYSPSGHARTAFDVVPECSLINGYMADVIASPGNSVDAFDQKSKSEAISRGWEHLRDLRSVNTEKLAAALRSVPTDTLDNEVEIPWGKQALKAFMTYPYWNMS